MYTFVASGDFHLDQGPVGSWRSNADAASAVVRAAIDRDADALVLAGDMFRNGRPTPEAILMAADVLGPLAGTGVRLLLLGGNHEVLNIPRGDRTGVEVLSGILAERGVDVTAVEREARMVDMGGARFLALPWLSKASVLAKHDKGALDPAAGDALVIQDAIAQMDALMDADDASGCPTVMTAHMTVDDCQIGALAQGRRRGSEVDLVSVFSEPVMPIAVIKGYGFAHVALSHIHPRQDLGASIRYSGSPNRLTFADAGDAKSCDLVTIDNATGAVTGVETIPTPARVMIDLDLADHDGAGDGLDGLAEGAWVRVRLPHGVAAVPDGVRDQVERAGARVVSIKRELAPRPQERRPSIEEGTTMAAALRSYLQSLNEDGASYDIDLLTARAQELAAAIQEA